MMQHAVKLKLNLFISLWCCATAVSGQVMPSGMEAELEAKIWEAIGGQETWQNARYFMFSCTGGKHSFAQGDRRYLWDKQTGNCRFDGMTTDDETVTVLFNTVTSTGTVYINNTKLENPRTTDDIVAEIKEEFDKDAQLLFLPTILEGIQASYKITGEKLIGSQRLTVINVENKRTSFATAVAGRLYVDSQTGQVLQWWPANGTVGFSVGEYKAIGSGLILPTRFNSSGTATSITYPIAAALVHIEGQKFSRP